MRTRPVTLLLPGLAALALVLGACGDADPPADETTPATEPASPTELAATPTDASPDGDSDAAAFFGDVAAAMAGQDSVRFTATFEDPTMGTGTVEGEVDQRTDPPATQVTVAAPDATMELRTVDGITYVTGIPDLVEEGTWLSLDPNDGTNPMAGMFDSLGSSADAAGQFEDMAQGATVEELGSEDVDGEQLDHYRITGQDGTVQDVWLDGQGLPRRIQDADGTTIEYHDWGAAVDIVAPDADSVRSFQDVLSEQMGDLGDLPSDLPSGLPDGLPSDLPSDLLEQLPDDVRSELDGLGPGEDI